MSTSPRPAGAAGAGPQQPQQQQQQQQQAGSDVILDGLLLKQHARSSKRWAERYFVLRGDNTLRYYHKKTEKPKAVYELAVTNNSNNSTTDCHVSDLFVDRYNKKLIYCIKLTWSSSKYAASGDGGEEDVSISHQQLLGGGTGGDDSSSLGDLLTSFAEGEEPPNILESSGISNQQQPQRPTSPFGPFRRTGGGGRRQQQQQQQRASPTPRSIDVETLSAVSIQERLAKETKENTTTKSQKKSKKRRKSNSKKDVAATPTAGAAAAVVPALNMSASNLSEADAVSAPHVPSMVEVDQRYYTTPPQTPTKLVRPVLPAIPNIEQQQQQQQARTPSYQDEEEQEEQLYLRSQYMTAQQASKRRQKQKVMQGTKLAAAAGATVGLAVVTAGIGLAAPLALLTAAAAVGGGGVAVNSKFGHSKKSGQLVIACHDYDTAKAWKSCLDAAVETAMVKSSTWGHLFSADAARLALLPTATTSNSRDAGDTAVAATHTNSNSSSPKNMAAAARAAAQDRTVLFESHTRWRPLEGGWSAFLGTGVQGLRIFREERRPPPTHGFGWGTAGASGNNPTTTTTDMNSIVTDLMVDGKPCAPVKAHTVLSTSALNAFLCVMSYGCCAPSSDQGGGGGVASGWSMDSSGAQFRVLEMIDGSTDVIHLVTLPLFLFPSSVAPRDYVLFRYWRLEPDGKYVICYESIEHESCPPMPNYVRGDMHQVITIAPHKKRLRRRGGTSGGSGVPNECLMTAVAQVDPKGWVPTRPISILANQSYADAFGISALLQLLDIRDAIDHDRFVPSQTLTHQLPMTSGGGGSSTGNNAAAAAAVAAGGIQPASSIDSMDDGLMAVNEDYVDYDYTYASHELGLSRTMSGLARTPPPLEMSKWVAPDPNSFRVRGKNYKDDKKKFNAGTSIGRLVAVDLVEVAEPIYSGLCRHPTERVQLALRKEAATSGRAKNGSGGGPTKTTTTGAANDSMPAFIFAVNIVVPGPPVFHAVFYYAVDDKSTIDGSDGTPSSRLAKEFFFGDSDEFRDRTFKLIPHIVQGNFIVRKAVGSTPALIGKKLRQLYIRSDRFCEVILDCGSSPVAASIIRISLGYAASLVVDMAFLLEGDEPAHLPERIFGCVRLKYLDFSRNIRFVHRPPLESDETE